MSIVLVSKDSEDANIDIYYDKDTEENIPLDTPTTYNSQILKEILNLNKTQGYAICLDTAKRYNIGIKKTVLYLIDFLNDNNFEWDIINISSNSNEIFAAQRSLKAPGGSSWESCRQFVGENLIKKIYTLPEAPASKKYYMNTACPIYVINLKNIKKICEILMPLKFNGILINFLENIDRLNLFFTNSHIFKITGVGDVETYNNYDPSIFFDWYGGKDDSSIFSDNLFRLKMHKSLTHYLTDKQILDRLFIKVNSRIVSPDLLRIKWFNDDSDFNIRNNLIEISISLKNVLSSFISTKDPTFSKELLIGATYLCPFTGKKISTEKKVFLKVDKDK